MSLVKVPSRSIKVPRSAQRLLKNKDFFWQAPHSRFLPLHIATSTLHLVLEEPALECIGPPRLQSGPTTGERREPCGKCRPRANARMENLERAGEGHIWLAHSKTDQSGRGAASEPGKPIKGLPRAAVALTAWLDASGVREGAIFRQVVHGTATEAGNQLVLLGEVMQLTGYKDVATALTYYQTGAVEQSKAANLLGAGATRESPRPHGGDEEALAVSGGPPQY